MAFSQQQQNRGKVHESVSYYKSNLGKLPTNTSTPWKFNIAPENIPSQKESSFPTIIFQGLC